MSVFSPKAVAAAIARLPSSSSQEIRVILARAREKSIASLVDACETELAKRPFDFTTDHVRAFDAMEVEVRDLSLEDAIRHAFTSTCPANAIEAGILRWIAAHPGGSFEDARKAYGKADLGLTIGHLVYDRYGCFRRFMKPGEDQSSVLLLKDRSGGSVRYTLRPEAAAVFAELGIT